MCKTAIFLLPIEKSDIEFGLIRADFLLKKEIMALFYNSEGYVADFVNSCA